MYYGNKNSHWIAALALFFYAILIVGLIAFSLWRPIDKVSNLREETIVVTDKMVKDDVYLIYSEDTTYEITDSWLYPRFNSSDLYGKIQVGESYNIIVGGSRIPFLSWYPNIYRADKIEKG